MIEMTTTNPPVSVFRLRLGVSLFVVWWLPIYLFATEIDAWLGIPSSSTATRNTVIVIMTVQTIIGLFGLYLVGGELADILKHTKFKKMPGVIWHLLWSGELKDSKPSQT
jgi:uncharacterized membrane protein